MARRFCSAAGVVKGRKCSCYPAVGPEVAEAGGKYVDIPSMLRMWMEIW